MPNQAKIIITSFFLPLFFFISGIFFKPLPWCEFLKKKFLTIIVPMIFFYWASCGWIYIRQLTGTSFQTPIRPINLIDFILPHENFYVNVALWYLIALFWTEIIANLLYSINNQLIRWGGVIISGILGFILPLPYFIDTALVALPIFTIGNLKINRRAFNMELNPWVLIIILSLCIFLLIMFAEKTNMQKNTYSNPISFYPLAIIGIIMIFAFSKLFGTIPLITTILGKYSLIVFSTHLMFRSPIESLVQQLELSQWFSVTILLIIEIIITPIIIKIFPFLLGIKHESDHA